MRLQATVVDAHITTQRNAHHPTYMKAAYHTRTMCLRAIVIDANHPYSGKLPMQQNTTPVYRGKHSLPHPRCASRQSWLMPTTIQQQNTTCVHRSTSQPPTTCLQAVMVDAQPSWRQSAPAHGSNGGLPTRSNANYPPTLCLQAIMVAANNTQAMKNYCVKAPYHPPTRHLQAHCG